MYSFSAFFEWAFLLDFTIDQFYFFNIRDIDSSSYSFIAIARQRQWDVEVVNH